MSGTPSTDAQHPGRDMKQSSSVHARRTRTGFTLMEVVVAGSIVGVVFLATLPLLAHVRAIRQEADRRSIAWQEAANLMEQIAVTSMREPLTPESVSGLTLGRASEALPDAALTVAVGPAPTVADRLPAVRADVTIAWTNDVGENAEPVSLSAWFPAQEVD